MNARRPNTEREDYMSRLAAYAWKCYATGQRVPHGTDDEMRVAAAVREQLLALPEPERERRLDSWRGSHSRTTVMVHRAVGDFRDHPIQVRL